MGDVTDIRIGVVIEVEVMQRLGDMARERGQSVPEVISAILRDAAYASDAPRQKMPDFADDKVPTDVVTRGKHKWRKVEGE